MKSFFLIALLCVESANVFASDVTLDLNVIWNDQKSILSIKTNLPPKTILMASLANPINQGGDGYFGQATAAVQANQVVQFGPFSKTGKSLSPGTYQLTVTTVMTALQPQETQAFFGEHGGKLTGRQVSTLPGTSERIVSETVHFKINPDGSTSNQNATPSDEHVIGSTDDIWRTVQSGGREIYVKTNGFYYTKEHYSGYGFHTYVVANLPESTIVGAPQSVMNDVKGNCETRTFQVLGTLFFAGKDRGGMAMKEMPPEENERRLVVNSPFEKAFDMLCNMARAQK